MTLALYAPLKPLDHPDPSGDRTIGRELAAALGDQGLSVVVPSRFRSRWFSTRPSLWLAALAERRRALEEASRARVSLWLSSHPYYNSPDVIGPYVARSSASRMPCSRGSIPPGQAFTQNPARLRVQPPGPAGGPAGFFQPPSGSGQSAPAVARGPAVLRGAGH